MKREIETKFDLPIEGKEEEILQKLYTLFKKEGYQIVNPRKVARKFTYYDTLDLKVHKLGGTIRLVEGFDKNKYKGIYRADLKLGSLEKRFEESTWCNTLEEVNKTIETYRQKIRLKNLSPVAVAITTHNEFDLTKSKKTIEAVLDYFKIGEKSFKEFELELKEGDEQILKEASQLVANTLRWKQLHEQKYSRIVNLLNGEYSSI